MNNNGLKIDTDADSGSASLIFTINAISRLSKEEFELLKRLRYSDELNNPLTRKEFESLSEVQKILNEFNAKSVRDVIEAVEKFKLFEIFQI